jgi:hypothetical protein
VRSRRLAGCCARSDEQEAEDDKGTEEQQQPGQHSLLSLFRRELGETQPRTGAVTRGGAARSNVPPAYYAVTAARGAYRVRATQPPCWRRPWWRDGRCGSGHAVLCG